MVEKYTLLNEPDKTMFVFERGGRVYGHILKNRTVKAPAKFIFETPSFETIDMLKAEYPPKEDEL